MSPRHHSPSKAVLFFCIVASAATLCARSKEFVKPPARPAGTYPAHDDHVDQKTAIAADPYDTKDKAKIFSIDFLNHDLLPVYLIITNDGDQPISMVNMEITLVTGNRARLTPLGTDDLYRRLSNPQANTNSNIPYPIPHKKVKGTLSQKQRDEISSAQFAARAVEPHSTQSGFLFFDVSDISNPTSGAHVYVRGVDDAKGTEMLYFDIPLAGN